jgi:hypothetical protein
MLVQLALIVTGLFAVLTLAVDFGYVTLTRTQMQDAADTAALEGLRLRDFDPTHNDDGFVGDCLRRLAARDLVAWTFDDNRNPGDGDPDHFGAGPIVTATPDLGALDAASTIDAPDPPVYKPHLQLNQAENRAEGDMVSGAFDAATSGDETGTYTRADLAPGTPVPPGASGLGECPADTPPLWSATPSGQPFSRDDAFLVRLRRTVDREGLDAIDGVSSAGPSLPLLFGRGALITSDPDAAAGSIRAEGIVVRGTAIARARPVLQAGVATSEWTGIVSFTLSAAAADALPEFPLAATYTLNVGAIHGDGEIGRFVSPADVRAVGALLPSAVPAPDCDTVPVPDPGDRPTIRGLVPLYADYGSGSRVTAYAFIRMEWPDCANDPLTITLTREAQRMAYENASTRPAPTLLTGVSAAELTAIRDSWTTRRDVIAFAPALVR